MSDNSFQCQPAYLLHHQYYRESSLLVDVLTRDFGKVSILAKGVRKPKSKNAAVLRPFQLLNLTVVGRSDLKTLAGAEILGKMSDLKGLALYCGYYVNELIHHFLHKYDPHPEIFQEYHDCLVKLEEDNDAETALRCFELNLIEKIGYGIHLSYDVKNGKDIYTEKKYRFNAEFGLTEDVNGLFSGASLLAMQKREFIDPKVRSEAKILMRLVIDSHLQGKQLKSRAVISNILKRLNHE